MSHTPFFFFKNWCCIFDSCCTMSNCLFSFLSGPLLSQCGRSSAKRDPYTKIFQLVHERSSIDSRTLSQLEISSFKSFNYFQNIMCKLIFAFFTLTITIHAASAIFLSGKYFLLLFLITSKNILSFRNI